MNDVKWLRYTVRVHITLHTLDSTRLLAGVNKLAFYFRFAVSLIKLKRQLIVSLRRIKTSVLSSDQSDWGQDIYSLSVFMTFSVIPRFDRIVHSSILYRKSSNLHQHQFSYICWREKPAATTIKPRLKDKTYMLYET
jgi:hypothetical protein